MAEFVINDETKKNSHGFYLVNAGGRFDRFNDNPVMLNCHDLKEVLGKWLNLRTNGNLLIADPEFDEGDPDAMKIKGKVDRGYLRGASPGIIILAAEWRENTVTHEQEIYVTDWELFESSVVSVPSNAGALTLKVYDANHQIVEDGNVKCHVENIIKLGLSAKETKTIITMNEEIKLSAEALVALGITGKVTPEVISTAALNLKVRAEKAEKELLQMQEKAEEERKKRAEELVRMSIQEGRITADKKEAFIRLALADYETVKTTLEVIPAKQSLSAQIQSIAGGDIIPAERKDWTLLQWMKNDMPGLKRLQIEAPEVYEQIKKKTN